MGKIYTVSVVTFSGEVEKFEFSSLAAASILTVLLRKSISADNEQNVGFVVNRIKSVTTEERRNT